jgi:hypothetical protein
MDAEKNRQWNAWLASRPKKVVVVGELHGHPLSVEVPDLGADD